MSLVSKGVPTARASTRFHSENHVTMMDRPPQYGLQRFDEVQAQPPVQAARSIISVSVLLLISRNWPDRLMRSTSRKTSDQLAPDKLSINSSRVHPGFALTNSRI